MEKGILIAISFCISIAGFLLSALVKILELIIFIIRKTRLILPIIYFIFCIIIYSNKEWAIYTYFFANPIIDKLAVAVLVFLVLHSFLWLLQDIIRIFNYNFSWISLIYKRKTFTENQENQKTYSEDSGTTDPHKTIFFKGVNNIDQLKKRYKDL